MRRLDVCPETISLLEAREITYHFEETTKAAALFNRLAAKDIKVGGIFHTTCYLILQTVSGMFNPDV